MSPNTASDTPFVSIVVPVLDDLSNLERCLERLTEQSYPKSKCEILVVDNGSSMPASTLAPQFPEVVFLDESTPSSYAARNRGIKASRGELIAFTDADCLPAADWIERGVTAVLRASRESVVGGHINLTLPPEPSAYDWFDKLFSPLDQERFIKRSGYAATANIFVRREIMETVGLFRSDLKSGGDAEWCQRARKKGIDLVYSREAVVIHPTRRSWDSLRNRERRWIGGADRLEKTKTKIFPGRTASVLSALSTPIRIDWIGRILRGAPLRVQPHLLVLLFRTRYVRAVEWIRLGFSSDAKR